METKIWKWMEVGCSIVTDFRDFPNPNDQMGFYIQNAATPPTTQ